MYLRSIVAGFVGVTLLMLFQASNVQAQHHGGGHSGGHVGGYRGGYHGGAYHSGVHYGGAYHGGSYNHGGLYHHGGYYHNRYPGAGLYLGLGGYYGYPYGSSYYYPGTSYYDVSPGIYDNDYASSLDLYRVPSVANYYTPLVDSYAVPPATDLSPIQPVSDAPAQVANLNISDTAFGQLVVNRGTRVTWANHGHSPHTVTSTQGLWDSGTIPPGYVYDCTFNQPGTFAFYDKSNPKLRGQIIVR